MLSISSSLLMPNAIEIGANMYMCSISPQISLQLGGLCGSDVGLRGVVSLPQCILRHTNFQTNDELLSIIVHKSSCNS